jgi:hypothetical protein
VAVETLEEGLALRAAGVDVPVERERGREREIAKERGKGWERCESAARPAPACPKGGVWGFSERRAETE